MVIDSKDKVSTLLSIHNFLLENNFYLTEGSNGNEIYIRFPSRKEKKIGRKIETIKFGLSSSNEELPTYSFEALNSGKYKNSELSDKVLFDYIIYDANLTDDFVPDYNFILPENLKKKKYNPDNFPYIKAYVQINSILNKLNTLAKKY